MEEDELLIELTGVRVVGLLWFQKWYMAVGQKIYRDSDAERVVSLSQLLPLFFSAEIGRLSVKISYDCFQMLHFRYQ